MTDAQINELHAQQAADELARLQAHMRYTAGVLRRVGTVEAAKHADELDGAVDLARTWTAKLECPIDSRECGSDCMFWPDRCTDARRRNNGVTGVTTAGRNVP